MRRRGFLTTLGCVSLAGCGRPAGTLEDPPNEPGQATPPPPTRTPTLDSSAPIAVTVEPEAVTGPQATIRVTLRNTGDRPFQTQESGLRLFKHVDGAWRYLHPQIVLSVFDPVYIRPAESYTFAVNMDNTDLTTTPLTATEEWALRLGPGRYRCLVRGGFVADTTTNTGPQDSVVVGTDLTVETAELSLPVTDTMTVDSRYRRTATVVPADATPSETEEVATLVTTRTDRSTLPHQQPTASGPVDCHVYTEELLNAPTRTAQQARNALAAVDPITERVYLHTPDHAVPPFSVGPEETAYTYYAGDIYEFRTANWSWDET